MSDALETYLNELRLIRSTGAAVPETSCYSALSVLLNEIGRKLKPKVRCIINLQNQGAGLPDGGLFTPDQFQKGKGEPLPGANPSRGAIEVKPTSEDIHAIAESEQIARYLKKYGQVLITNYRDFLLMGYDASGKAVKLEEYHLAGSEKEFWAAAAHPRKMAEDHGERFTQYLQRVMLHAAPLATPEDVAWFLASYARDAKARIEKVELPALQAVRTALEEALGLEFKGEKGENFFRSTLVQTLFYGIFSAWVLWCKNQLPAGAEPPAGWKPAGGLGGADGSSRFNWHEAAWSLHVPMIRALFDQIATPTMLGPLGLVEVLDWTGAVLDRVDRASFFERFEQGHAVQYFYEPFLQAFDPELRKELGVWYTPPEIVQYMVARVDTVLREELGIEDGLADPNVYILDPCCGTGAYLVEVLKSIAATLQKKGGDALVAHDVKQAAMHRVFGFEILPSPFVVSHLQLGLLLQNLGAPLADETERAGVYLTNALTGWEPPKGPKQHLIFPELEEERDAADEVKRDKPILVILGNPPYNAFAGVSPTEEQGLVESYKEGLISEWGIKKFNLDDLYVRFFRLAERRIAEKTGRGVVCFISNFSYLSDPSFVVMRKRFLKEFDSLWFDCMNGDSRETGKLTPEGKPDPSVFSTEYNREGIRVGTTIGLIVRKSTHEENPTILFRNFWGITKRLDLVQSLKAKNLEADYEISSPTKSNRFSFRPSEIASHYLKWPKLIEICRDGPYQGLSEDRRKALLDINRECLKDRMRRYFDKSITWQSLREAGGPLIDSYVDFPAEKTRELVLKTYSFDELNIHRYAMRPFDLQYCYFTSIRPIWRRHRPEFYSQCWKDNSFIASRFKCSREPEGAPISYITGLCDYHYLPPNAGAIPIRFRPSLSKKRNQDQIELHESATLLANLSPLARAYLASLGIANPDADAETAGLIWMHALAIGYSPSYLTENADGIRQDWPRIPLPNSKAQLLASAALGKQVAGLLDTENPVKGVTGGAIRPELLNIGVISRVGSGNLQEDDLAVTAGWGHAGKGGVTMPAKGKVMRREYSAEEKRGTAVATLRSSDAIPLRSTSSAVNNNINNIHGRDAHATLLGDTTCDIYLNGIAYWRNIPEKVWNYTIGGYQVMKKWLSYREQALLGRALTTEEVREVTNMARRIAAIILLESQLNENYRQVKENNYPWQDSKDEGGTE